MARKKKRPRPTPDVEIIEILQPAPADLDLAAKWYLVWTTPRGEAKAQENLEKAGCMVFWPHIERVIRRKKKPEVRNLVSTFPRYLFASGLPSLARRLTVVGPDGHSGVTIDGRPIDDIREIEGVVAVVSNAAGWCKVPGAAIAAVARYQGDEARPVPPPRPKPVKPIEPGARVRIIDGPFTNFQATVIDMISEDAAKVLIDIFGRQTQAEMEIAHVEAA